MGAEPEKCQACPGATGPAPNEACGGHGFCITDIKSNAILTSTGRLLIEKMGITPKPMKRLKISGNDASELIDKMFSELQ